MLLARAIGLAQRALIGDQTGGRGAMFLNTLIFERDYERMRAARVVFEEVPRHEPYGTVAVFRDLYGNRWDLIQSNGTGADLFIRSARGPGLTALEHRQLAQMRAARTAQTPESLTA